MKKQEKKKKKLKLVQEKKTDTKEKPLSLLDYLKKLANSLEEEVSRIEKL